MPLPDSFLRPFQEPPPSHTMEFISEVVPAPPSVYTFRYPIREALIPKPSRKASRSLSLHKRSKPWAASQPWSTASKACRAAGGGRQLHAGTWNCAAPWNCTAITAQPRGNKAHRQERNTSEMAKYTVLETSAGSASTWNNAILQNVPASPSLSLLTLGFPEYRRTLFSTWFAHCFSFSCIKWA